MVSLGSSITVVNKSGKVVSNVSAASPSSTVTALLTPSKSKHLVNVFKEAKAAYLDKKAELRLARQDDAIRAQRRPGSSSNEQSRSPSPYDDHHRPDLPHRRRRPSANRGHSDSFYAADSPTRQPHPTRRSPPSPTADEYYTTTTTLPRRHSSSSLAAIHRKPLPTTSSSPNVQPDDLTAPPLPPRRSSIDLEVRSKMFSLQRLLEESQCIQHTASMTIQSLEKNPERMAAVALTLAEISNLLTKMAPGALSGLARVFPAVVALLISPEFLIAVGVGVGITVVALGSYKVVKKIKAMKSSREGKGDRVAVEVDAEVDELEDVRELERVSAWRRAVDDAERESLGTSVEGEFATPGAAGRMREAGLLMPMSRANTTALEDLVGPDAAKSGKKKKKEKASKGGSTANDKDPSGLKMLFKRKG